jgi:hypothetical protein
MNAKINPSKTIEPKLKSKSQKRTKLILNTDNDLTNNSIVNTNFISKPIDLSYFSKFPGFFNRNFNLTTFKKQKEESRSHSKSPEKIRLPNHMRGNGIPNNINERLKFLNNIFQNEKFQKVYKKSPKRNEYNFEDLLDYILNY